MPTPALALCGSPGLSERGSLGKGRAWSKAAAKAESRMAGPATSMDTIHGGQWGPQLAAEWCRFGAATTEGPGSLGVRKCTGPGSGVRDRFPLMLVLTPVFES